MVTIIFPDSKFFDYNGKFQLTGGEYLPGFTLAYETFGEPDPDMGNVILIFHALSGSAHVTRSADQFETDTGIKGWWEKMVGPGKPIDTDKYYVICANVLGSCYGSTSPASINPSTGKPYALDFPIITVHDMVEAQVLLLKHLGIEKLYAVIGGSMGGMQAIDFALNHPEMTERVIPISTTAQSTPQNIAFHAVGRHAIMADPAWNNGNYYNSEPPKLGLSIARMIGHITYLSDKSMKAKFGRRYQKDRLKKMGKLMEEENTKFSKFLKEFEVEGYLEYKGSTFIRRFDANSYLYITKAIDYFDVYGDPIINNSLKTKKDELARTSFLFLSFTSDWLYPTEHIKKFIRFLKRFCPKISFCEIESDYGHDSFLLETDFQGRLVSGFLESGRNNGK